MSRAETIQRWILCQQQGDVQALGRRATLRRWWATYAAEYDRRVAA